MLHSSLSMDFNRNMQHLIAVSELADKSSLVYHHFHFGLIRVIYINRNSFIGSHFKWFNVSRNMEALFEVKFK